MKIEIKYNIGDVIKYKHKILHEVFEPCTCCDGVGKIIGADGDVYLCPKCEGNKSVKVGELEEEIEKEGTINRILINYDSMMECYHGKPWIYYNVPQNTYNIMQEDIIGKI